MDDTNNIPFEIPRHFTVLAAIIGSYAFLATLNVLRYIQYTVTLQSQCTGTENDIESNNKNSISDKSIPNLRQRYTNLLSNTKQTKKRTIALLKDKKIFLLVASILISLLSYALIYVHINNIMSESVVAIENEIKAIQLKMKNELEIFDPHEILQIKPNANRRKVDKAFKNLAAKVVASPNTKSDSVTDTRTDVETLSSLFLAHYALTDEEGQENFLRHGHPNGPVYMNDIVLPPRSISFFHPFVSCMDPGSIIFLLTFISLLAVLIKTSPVLQRKTSTVVEVKPKPTPPFIYTGGRAPKDIHVVIIDPSVIIIEANAFRECTSLQDVRIPYNVKEIHKSAFRDCTALRDVTFLTPPKLNVSECPESSPSHISNAVLVETSSHNPSKSPLPHINSDADNSTTSPPLIFETVASDNSHTVIIGKSLFRGCRSLETITLPFALTKIPKSTFQGCTNLSSINPPLLPTLEKVGDEAFDGCAALRSVSLLPCVKKIGICAFHSCQNLEFAEVLSPRTKIGKYAFAKCLKLEYLPIGYSNEKGRHDNNTICDDSTVMDNICVTVGGKRLDGIGAIEFQDGIRQDQCYDGVVLV